MAHGTLIGGAAYGITGGKTRIGGTNYSINKGRTLVGGTGYDISFNQTWEKWKLNTTYNCYEKYIEGNITGLAYRSFYGLNNRPFYSLYYSANRPTFNDSGSGAIWSGGTPLIESIPSNYPYTVSSEGYYYVFNEWSSYSLANVFLLEAETVISLHPTNSAYVRFPGENCIAQIYPEKETLYSKGTTSYGTVTAPAGTYPDNGRSGDYWYVLIS